MTEPSYEELRITKRSGSPEIADSAPGDNSSKAATEIRKGFTVEIAVHTKDGRKAMPHPERVREIVGDALDKLGINEEIDYTLSVGRIYQSE